jgi:small GTP-binding protein
VNGIENKKIILAGDGGVGRTTLLHCYLEGEFNPNTRMTIGFDFRSKELEIEQREVKMIFCDLAGQQRFRRIQKAFIGNTHGAILAFDLTRPLTLENVEEWVTFLRSSNPDLPILLVGLKADLITHIEIDDAYLLHKVDALNLIGYIKASSKTGFNVELIFEILGRDVLGLPELERPYPDPLSDLENLNQESLTDYSQMRLINPHQMEISQITINDLIRSIKEKFKGYNQKGINEKGEYIEIFVEDLIESTLQNVINKPKFFKALFFKEFSTIKNQIISFLANRSHSKKNVEDLFKSISNLLTPLINTFIISEQLCLRYENGETHIYVNDQRLYQCKYLLLNIDTTKIETYDSIQSIDEAAETLDHTLELTSQNFQKIDTRTEFWGHCSNIQVWWEQEYDTRILHRNLAFPLLKKLAEAGDKCAQRVFKEEIARRFESGFPSVILYLLEEGYLLLLNKLELDALDLSNVEYNDIEFWEKLAELYLSHNLNFKVEMAVKNILKINPNYKFSNLKLSHYKSLY